MRPVRNPDYVWCDVHSEIHAAVADIYLEGDEHCNPANWRPVYILGEKGEFTH